MRTTKIILWTAPLLAAMSSQALAQQTAITPDTVIARAEARADRSADRSGATIASFRNTRTFLRVECPDDVECAQPVAEGSTAKEPKWSLTGESSISYTDNIDMAETGQLEAAHLYSSLGLGFKTKLAPSVTLSIAAGTEYDKVFDLSDRSSSAWSAGASVAFRDRKKVLAPYLQHASQGLYQGMLGEHIVTTHTYGIGIGRTFALARDNQASFDVRALRRDASQSGSEQNRLQLEAAFAGPVATDVSWNLNTLLQYADYTAGTATSREDISLRLIGNLSWAITDNLALNSNLVLLRNWSNIPGKSFSNLDAGLSIGLSAAF